MPVRTRSATRKVKAREVVRESPIGWILLFIKFVWAPVLVVTSLLVVSTNFQRQVLFLHNVRWPLLSSRYQDLEYTFGSENVEKYSVKNIHVESSDSIILNGYLLEPPTQLSKKIDDPAIIFFHGNAASRALSWRLTHAMKLADSGAAVYAFDLRGFGDVAGSPSEAGVNDDAIAIFNHVRKRHDTVFLYGHSLGTAISSKLLFSVCENNPSCLSPSDDSPFITGILLDSPFVNATMAALHHPTTAPIRYLVPFGGQLISSRFVDTFDTDLYLSKISSVPLLILHGDADAEIPLHKCGGAVLLSALRASGREHTTLEVFSGVGHEVIHEQQTFESNITSFMKEAHHLQMKAKVAKLASNAHLQAHGH